MKHIAWGFVLIFSLSTIGLTGCGSDVKMNPESNIMSVDYAKQAREMFDKYDGKYESLTPNDKENYLKLFNNDEAKGKKIWDLMANPPSSGVAGMPSSN